MLPKFAVRIMEPKKILLIGAGKSATTLIEYLLDHASMESWKLTVADMDREIAQQKVGSSPFAEACALSIDDVPLRQSLIKAHDLIVSMLPAHKHIEVAQDCVAFGKHMVTASYVSPEMEALHEEAEAKGLLLLNEMGVDPGIDHMTAMEVMDKIKAKGGEIIGFESFTGGLMAPGSEEGPWKYKFTWNPRNIVLAASGGAVKFLHGGKFKYIPYHKVFRRTELIDLGAYGEFEAYGNRDSLRYQSMYGLEGVDTLYRGTLRRPGFCQSWDVFVQLGATDDSYLMEGVGEMTHREFINSFLYYSPSDSVELKLAHMLRLDLQSEPMRRLKWLGMFEEEPVGLSGKASPATVLQHILQKKWSLAPHDRDMIVMVHLFDYKCDGVHCHLRSHLVVEGDDAQSTAMAKTVGLPMGIAIRNILNGTIAMRGVRIPVHKEIYAPVLSELSVHGIGMQETFLKGGLPAH